MIVCIADDVLVRVFLFTSVSRFQSSDSKVMLGKETHGFQSGSPEHKPRVSFFDIVQLRLSEPSD